jgi:hypothetical protein
MLSKFDDYPIHQTPEPVSHPVTSDRNFYDRYWLNGYAVDGEFYFAVGMAVYPHREILDCAFSIVRDGEQHSFHASRRAPRERGDTCVGPFRLEVPTPMQQLRVVLDPNETGIACDLTFTARTAAVEEGRQTSRSGTRAVMDATRFAQFGSWQGDLSWAGGSQRVEPSRVRGAKDRSWGVRRIGEPETGGAPPTSLPQLFFLWSNAHWDAECTHFGLFENADGSRWHQGGAIVPAYGAPEEIPGVEDPATRHFPTLEHRIDYQPGTRWARAARISLLGRAGERHDIELEPLLRFQMKGLGYFHPAWGQGMWKGELAVGGDSWKLADLDPLAVENIHLQQVMRARWGGREGVGVLEQLALGPHEPSGFEGLLDGAG